MSAGPAIPDIASPAPEAQANQAQAKANKPSLNQRLSAGLTNLQGKLKNPAGPTGRLMGTLANMLHHDASQTDGAEADGQSVGDVAGQVETSSVLNDEANDQGSQNRETQEAGSEKNTLTADETQYLSDNRYDEQKRTGFRELDARYADTRTGAEHIMGQLDVYAANVGIPQIPDELPGIPETAQDQASYIKGLVLEQVKRAFSTDLVKPGETPTPEQLKAESVLRMSQQYIDLAFAARAANELGANLSDADFVRNLSRMTRENILKLSYQDYIAAENTLGDHGVRHLVDHNINVTQQLADQLEANGQKVSSADRLMMYQIMIDHDMGYAMDPVREKINADPPQMWADRGHNVLAAKFLRERAAMGDDALAHLFSADQIATMHQGILTHDASTVDFKIGSEAPEARRENIMSAIHLADNTHAFETKLPEVLFGNPESLRILLLMKVAAESGMGTEVLDGFKLQLQQQIQGQEGWSDRYKASLSQAVSGLSADSYRFTVPRICGNNPEFAMDANGRVRITVDESFAHREVMGLFGETELKQFQKFVRDLNAREIDPNAESVGDEQSPVVIALRRTSGEEAAQETAYQREVLRVLTTEPLRTFLYDYEGLANERKLHQQEHPDDTAGLEAINARARALFAQYQQAEALVRNQQGGGN